MSILDGSFVNFLNGLAWYHSDSGYFFRVMLGQGKRH